MINSFPAIDEISRQLTDNASPPLMSFYGNPCSRYITVRKALAPVLKSYGTSGSYGSEYKTIAMNGRIRENVEHIYVDHVLTILNLIGTK